MSPWASPGCDRFPGVTGSRWPRQLQGRLRSGVAGASLSGAWSDVLLVILHDWRPGSLAAKPQRSSASVVTLCRGDVPSAGLVPVGVGLARPSGVGFVSFLLREVVLSPPLSNLSFLEGSHDAEPTVKKGAVTRRPLEGGASTQNVGDSSVQVSLLPTGGNLRGEGHKWRAVAACPPRAAQPLRKAVAGAPRLQAAESERPAGSVGQGRARFPQLCQGALW